MGGVLGVAEDRVLAGLSAESRALLELSVRRGIPDEEIASRDEEPQGRTLQLGPAAQLEALPGMPEATARVDISLEPDDRNANHSGDSYLRVPLARLRP
jgi:hypothetical protein